MKKHLLSLVFITICTTTLLAQKKQINRSKTAIERKQELEDEKPKIFLQLSSGLDNPQGLIGVGVDVALKKHFMVGIGAGASSWGNKYNIHGSYFLKEKYLGSSFGFSLNRSTGFELELDSTSSSPTNQSGSNFYGTLGGITSLNLMYAQYWKVGKRSRFFMQTGLASKLGKLKMDLRYWPSGFVVDEKEIEYLTTKMLSPGGFVANFGFLIRLK